MIKKKKYEKLKEILCVWIHNCEEKIRIVLYNVTRNILINYNQFIENPIIRLLLYSLTLL